MKDLSVLSKEDLIKLVEFYRRDSLTGLKMRKDFEVEFYEHFKSGVSFYLILVDINGLKEVNTKNGYLAGDDLIRRVANYLEYNCSGKIFRLGGDELVLLHKNKSVTCVPTEDFCMSVVHSIDFTSTTDMFKAADNQLSLEKLKYYSTTGKERRKR